MTRRDFGCVALRASELEDHVNVAADRRRSPAGLAHVSPPPLRSWRQTMTAMPWWAALLLQRDHDPPALSSVVLLFDSGGELAEGVHHEQAVAVALRIGGHHRHELAHGTPATSARNAGAAPHPGAAAGPCQGFSEWSGRLLCQIDDVGTHRRLAEERLASRIAGHEVHDERGLAARLYLAVNLGDRSQGGVAMPHPIRALRRARCHLERRPVWDAGWTDGGGLRRKLLSWPARRIPAPNSGATVAHSCRMPQIGTFDGVRGPVTIHA